MYDKYNTIAFCRRNYEDKSRLPHDPAFNECELWDDIQNFVRIAIKNGYQIKIHDDGMTIIIEYNYQDESISGISLEWLDEDEYVCNVREELEDESNSES